MATRVHIYAPNYAVARLVRKCVNCRSRKRVVARLYGWCESSFTCTGCGDDPRVRGYRFKAITAERRRRIERAVEDWQRGKKWKEAVKEMWALRTANPFEWRAHDK